MSSEPDKRADRPDGWPPRWLSKHPDGRFRSQQAIDFIEAFATVTKDSVAGPTGSPIVLRGWQKNLIHGLLAENPNQELAHRLALIGMPRKNGKSALGSSIALWSLFCGVDGGEVYSCAGDRDQARIVFDMARRMVENSEELSELARVYKNAIEIPSTGSVWRVLSAEAYTKEGLSPTFVMFDEVHVQPNDELWNVMALAGGARNEPMLCGITTAGVRTDSFGQDSLCYRLYQHGQKVVTGEVDDPSFFFAWWEPAAGTDADHTDPEVWAESNPGFDDIVRSSDFSSMLGSTSESEFRTKRTNVWVTTAESALPHGAWDACAKPRALEPGERAVLFLDGAWNGDCTGIVGCTLSHHHLFQAGLWEGPPDDIHWRVPILEVEAAVPELYKKFGAVELACDPFRWQRSMAVWEEAGLNVVEFPTNSIPRIVPAWKQFYEAVMDQLVTHDGAPALARHIENMQLKIDDKGARPVKEHKMSKRHIDLGICAVGAYHRACFYEDSPEPFVLAI